jgi:hypothetical protein
VSLFRAVEVADEGARQFTRSVDCPPVKEITGRTPIVAALAFLDKPASNSIEGAAFSMVQYLIPGHHGLVPSHMIRRSSSNPRASPRLISSRSPVYRRHKSSLLTSCWKRLLESAGLASDNAHTTHEHDYGYFWPGRYAVLQSRELYPTVPTQRPTRACEGYVFLPHPTTISLYVGWRLDGGLALRLLWSPTLPVSCVLPPSLAIPVAFCLPAVGEFLGWLPSQNL